MTISTNCAVAPQPIHGVVVFDPAAFKVLFPQFAAVADVLLTLYFDLATQILNNTCSSIVVDAVRRERLLNLLVAHIATLLPTVTSGGGAGSGATGTGRVMSATEGSVSISFGEYAKNVSQSMAYFIQTQWGALFWQLTADLRSFRYVGPPSCCGPAGVFAGRRG